MRLRLISLVILVFSVLSINVYAQKPSAPRGVKPSRAATTLGTTASCPAGVDHCANLSWTAPTSGGAPTGYNVYRTTTSGGCSTVTSTGCTKSGSTTASVLTFTDSPLAASTTYFWVATAFNTSGESAPSTQATGTTNPDPAPVAPTNLTVTSIQ